MAEQTFGGAHPQSSLRVFIQVEYFMFLVFGERDLGETPRLGIVSFQAEITAHPAITVTAFFHGVDRAADQAGGAVVKVVGNKLTGCRIETLQAEIPHTE